ncbi:MAG: agarase [Rhizobiales bacterium]|nr:agarase [Hyphomicrobiales bacterium]
MPVQVAKTRWGGIADGRFRPAGFFRVGQSDGVFWLIDPIGGRYLSKGINTVRFDQDAIQNSKRIPYAEACGRKYGSESAWRTAAARRLASWGFNTLGSWSDEVVANAAPLAVTPNLDLGMSFAWQRNDSHPDDPPQDFPDVFDPEFVIHIRRRAQELCAKRSGEQRIIGWFIDNELRWGPDWRGPEQLLPLFLKLSAKTPGRIAAAEWLRARRNSADATPSAADSEAFAGQVADRYFALTVAAIKAADPSHLVLGCRFALPPPAAVIAAAGRHLEVISFNCYGPDANGALDAYAATGKPCLIGEFSFRGADSGLPNSNGAGPVVTTQGQRAAAFRHYVTTALQRRTLVGYHWFEHADQPAEGRFDGENSNFGTVTIKDDVYEEITRTMAAVNAEAESLHAAAGATS